MHHPRIAIIGAGIAGSACAARLAASQQFSCTIFEKSRGRGGRCATRRDSAGHLIDHGAQFFTMRDPGFSAAARLACGDDLAVLTAPVTEPDGSPVPSDDRWYHRLGNSRLPRALAPEADVRTGTEITNCQPDGDGWSVSGEFFDAIVSTAPLPQTWKLFQLPGTPPDGIPCLTSILLLDGPPSGRCADDYAIRDLSGHPLAWTACENHKAGRIQGAVTAIVSQASEEFSRHHLEEAPDSWGKELAALTAERWNFSASRIASQHHHRWRFARFLPATPPPPLPPRAFFAGDALTAPRIESAWRSGHDAAAAVAAAFSLTIP
jgi:predicted NAD/FAD-dependent oxidoreductase